jgi:hypothetical protein
VRRLLESLAVGVACSSTGRSGQSLPEQRETEAAGAARVAGGGCATSFRRGLQEQLESLAPGGSSCGSTCYPRGYVRYLKRDLSSRCWLQEQL